MKKRLAPLARKLRNDPTEAEKKLWKHIRYKQLDGLKFRRQQPLGPYVVDFVNFEGRIVIEVDGGQHMHNRQEDIERDEWLQNQGFEVLRFWNNEVLENTEGVLEVIRNKCFPPSLAPPARGGE